MENPSRKSLEAVRDDVAATEQTQHILDERRGHADMGHDMRAALARRLYRQFGGHNVQIAAMPL